MRIDAHSVVYFVNEEYGVVMKATGATGEVAMWDAKREGFTRRLDLLTASFLARVDRVDGEWCAAHPTYSLLTAKKAAATLTAKLPNKDGMRVAREAKKRAMRAMMNERGCERMIREIKEQWRAREAKYARI